MVYFARYEAFSETKLVTGLEIVTDKIQVLDPNKKISMKINQR